MENICISKKFLENITRDKVSGKCILAYVFLQNEISNRLSNNTILTSPLKIHYDMLERITIGDREIKGIRDGINELIGLGYLKIEHEFQYGMTLYNIDDFIVDRKNGYYFYIYKSEVIKLINDSDVDKYNLLKYYIVLMSNINYNSKVSRTYRGKICKISFSQLSEMSNIASSTCMRYNEKLVENKIVNIESGMLVDAKSMNTYSRYCNKEIHEKYLKEVALIEVENRVKRVNKIRRKQSISRRYNTYIENKDIYKADINKLITLIKDCIMYNYDIDEIKEICNSKGVAFNEYNEKKDVSIFPSELVKVCEDDVKINMK